MERKRQDILLFLGFLVLVGVAVFATHMSEASGQAPVSSTMMDEIRAQTRAQERQARALEGIQSTLQRMERRCR